MSALSGYAEGKSTERAAETAAEAQEKGAELAYRVYQQQAAGMQPWVQSGGSNLARLNYALYGQLPTAESLRLDPNSAAYKNYLARNPGMQGKTLYQNPITGEISDTAPMVNANQMGVQGGGINPSDRFTTADWQASPEYAAYAGARNAALDRTSADLAAQAGASGMYGSGNVANALAQNVGQLYAQYDPASLAAAQDRWNAARTQEFNQLAALANPNGVAQTAGYLGQYGETAANALANAGALQAQGILGQGQAFSNALGSGLNTAQGITNAIRSNRSQPTGASVGGWNTGGTNYGGDYWQNTTTSVDAYGGGDYY